MLTMGNNKLKGPVAWRLRNSNDERSMGATRTTYSGSIDNSGTSTRNHRILVTISMTDSDYIPLGETRDGAEVRISEKI